MAGVAIDQTADTCQPLLAAGALKAKQTDHAQRRRLHEALPHSGAILGYTLMFFAGFSQATRNFLFHLSETRMGVPASAAFTISSIGFTVCTTVCLAVFGLFHHCRQPPTQLLRLAARGICAALTIYLNDVALKRIPVGMVMTLLSTIPAITSVFAALFLGDALGSADILILLLNMVGVVLVAQPSGHGDDPEAVVGIIAVLGAATFASAGFILVKKMGVRVHFALNTLAIGLGGIFLSLFVTSVDDMRMVWAHGMGAFVTVCGALCGYLTQSLVNCGMQMCRPGPALVVRSCNVPVAILLGLVFMGEGMSGMGFFGVAIILGCVVYIGVNSFVRERAKEEEFPLPAKNAKLDV